MLFSSRTTAVFTAAALGAVGASAAITTSCPQNDRAPCYSWAAHPSNGNVYFQVRAPASFAWAGVGIGQDMSDADVFIVYQNGNGNVTLSSRHASMEGPPTPVQRSDLTLLAGSGIIDNVMVANVKCSNCPKLPDLKGTSNWIAAWKAGSAIDSTSNSAQIIQHDAHAQLQVNFANAQLTDDSNPFLNTDNNKGNDNGSSGSYNGGSTGGNSGNTPVVIETSTSNTLLYAHGILMMIVWTAMYPLGAVIMPLVGRWYIHAGWQTITFLAMWAGLGLGYTLANQRGLFFNNTHTQLGIMACALMSIQPIIGMIHHRGYKKTQRRSWASYAHIWYGRIIMLLGIINGGLGLRLVGTEGAMKQAYIAMAVIFPVLYAGGVVYGLTKRRASAGREKTPPSRSSA